jgi:hypothetical protein
MERNETGFTLFCFALVEQSIFLESSEVRHLKVSGVCYDEHKICHFYGLLKISKKQVLGVVKGELQ